MVLNLDIHLHIPSIHRLTRTVLGTKEVKFTLHWQCSIIFNVKLNSEIVLF